jgi:polyisoprenoid-binding protein YceI
MSKQAKVKGEMRARLHEAAAVFTLSLWLLSLAPAAPSAGQAQMRTYTITASESEVTVVAYQEGLMSKLRPQHAIAVKSFSGRVQFRPGDLQVSLEIEAETKSLAVMDQDLSDFERTEFQRIMHEVVLETLRFPKIKFRSVSVTDLRPSGEGQSFTLNGDLTLHGVTKRMAVPVVVTISPQELRAAGEATLKQSDFEIKPYVGALGAIKIKDAVKVSFAITAKA